MRHVAVVAELLGFGYTLVYRRMKGEVAWELEEIEAVAAHFGESLASLFGAARPGERDHEPAILVVEGLRLQCKVLIGSRITEPDRNSLVAIRVGTQWMVVAAAQAGQGAAFAVRQLLVDGTADRARRIAILDDDADEASSISDYLATQGCEPHAFTRVEALLAHMKLRPFDAYVIDWVLAEGDAAELVAMIRADDPQCPIAILTGKMESDIRIENAVAEALSAHRLMFFQKPTRLPVISSQILGAFGGH
jgi:CheY-like chemotaxis protein